MSSTEQNSTIIIEEDPHSKASKIAYGAFAIVGMILFFTLMLMLTKKRYATSWTKTVPDNNRGRPAATTSPIASVGFYV